jgi:hypothetical protein
MPPGDLGGGDSIASPAWARFNDLEAYMRLKRFVLAATVLVALPVVALPIMATPVLAVEQCAVRKITATGQAARFAFFARSSAKTAWTAKITRDTKLGPVYSQWSRAQDQRTVCRKIDTRWTCIAAGLPCRNR